VALLDQINILPGFIEILLNFGVDDLEVHLDGISLRYYFGTLFFLLQEFLVGRLSILLLHV